MPRSFFDDLRFAVRSYGKTPGFTAVALLTLALGTGANATVFMFVNSLLFQPARVPEPASLVSLYTEDFSSGPFGETSYPDFLTLRQDTSAFDVLAAHDGGLNALLRTADAVERIHRVAVSPEFFGALRIGARQGRLIGPADFAAGAPPVVVISEETWQRLFGGVPDILLQQVTIDGRSHAIVGVVPRGFVLNLGARVDAWVPWSDAVTSAGRGDRSLDVIGRLRSGRTIVEAQTEVSTIAARLGRAFPDSNLGTLQRRDQPRAMTVLRHTRLPPAFRAEVAMLAGVLMAAVGLVLLIACANIANLLLSRAAGRLREMAVRRALGAPRGRVAAQVLTETLLLGFAGGGLGVLVAMWTSDALPSFFPAEQAEMLATRVDGRVFGYTLLTAMVASVLFGIPPAIQAMRAPLGDALRTARGLTAGRVGARLRFALVTAQIALATVLLVGAGLLLRSLANAQQANLGFGTRDAVVLTVEQPHDRDASLGLAYYDRLLDRVRALPGTPDASLARTLPLFGSGRRGFRPEGYEFQPGETTEFSFNVVSSSHFDALQIPVLAGRTFDTRDTADSPPVAIVNDIMASRYYGDEAIGRRIVDSRGTVLTIVGVVRTGKHTTVQEQPVPVVYFPLAQSYLRQMTLIARTDGRAESFVADVRRATADTDRAVAVFRVGTLAGRLREALTTDRLAAALMGACGALALLLAAVGLYGVVAFAVARRAREFGIRVALGAGPAEIVRLVLREGARVTAAGLAVGLATALLAGRGLASLLFGVTASDTLTFSAVSVALAAVTILATLVPARRALRLDPIIVLREE